MINKLNDFEAHNLEVVCLTTSRLKRLIFTIDVHWNIYPKSFNLI